MCYCSNNSGDAGCGGVVATIGHGNSSNATLWARIPQNVKKSSLTVNVMDLEFFGFNVSIIHMG